MSSGSNSQASSRGSVRKKIGLFFVGVTAIFLIWTVICLFPNASNKGYGPTQPIPFSHRLHAGTHKIDCQYCHSQAERSQHASIPSLNVCMNCHSVVKTDSPYIQNLTKHYKEGKPIEWVRVHELPDHVRFSHSPHIRKGIGCETCHGDVRSMDKVQQVGDLTMGWCLNCHRNRAAPSDVIATVRPKGMPDDPNHKGPLAPFSCSTCHY